MIANVRRLLNGTRYSAADWSLEKIAGAIERILSPDQCSFWFNSSRHDEVTMKHDNSDELQLPDESDMLDAVLRSGYLLDQEVATSFEELGFHVQTSWPFEDPDKGESRELDVWAIRRVTEDPISLFIEIFCECKSGQANPYVFLTRRKGPIDDIVSPIHYVFPRDNYSVDVDGGMREVPAFTYFNAAQHHYWFKNNQKAVQFARIVRNKNRWDAQHNGIYNSLLIPLAKALRHRRAVLRRYTPFAMCFPLVVLKSPLYLVDSETKPLAARKVTRVSFYRRLDSSTVKGDYIVDFVNADGLADFVDQKVMPFAKQLADDAKANPDKFRVQRPT